MSLEAKGFDLLRLDGLMLNIDTWKGSPMSLGGHFKEVKMYSKLMESGESMTSVSATRNKYTPATGPHYHFNWEVTNGISKERQRSNCYQIILPITKLEYTPSIGILLNKAWAMEVRLTALVLLEIHYLFRNDNRNQRSISNHLYWKIQTNGSGLPLKSLKMTGIMGDRNHTKNSKKRGQDKFEGTSNIGCFRKSATLFKGLSLWNPRRRLPTCVIAYRYLVLGTQNLDRLIKQIHVY
ncbi:uncharacterized protein PGTG_07488 [Puccinia graminis f. sp. tritici CRL 75-36-700-3]|uniref:Uncharacterized protein n=1 Tax=Puccinia graminis f. sp. tritici (strain CRL 75-36-700-3 / race SCCL) TaxID=418459 RepID=E3KD45_PUCGT|nr:uncharacterized protein PGTG_07488 [Puccinia graminis f. sp. tritici CRL 75-36-700-3]EFP82091.1 hypothetical protein PGTG_07488 [Puccinia graminis f. sp. tritici CRL 75-36-700-3]